MQTGLSTRSATPTTVQILAGNANTARNIFGSNNNITVLGRLWEFRSKPVRRRHERNDTRHKAASVIQLGHQFLGQQQHHHVDRRVLQRGEEHRRQRQRDICRWPRQQPELGPQHVRQRQSPIQWTRQPQRRPQRRRRRQHHSRRRPRRLERRVQLLRPNQHGHSRPRSARACRFRLQGQPNRHADERRHRDQQQPLRWGGRDERPKQYRSHGERDAQQPQHPKGRFPGGAAATSRPSNTVRTANATLNSPKKPKAASPGGPVTKPVSHRITTSTKKVNDAVSGVSGRHNGRTPKPGADSTSTKDSADSTSKKDK